VVLPLDIATAQDMNERHDNDVALANGTGLNDGGVTPEKRGGGFAVGRIAGSTQNTICNLSVSTLDCKSRVVRFRLMINTGYSTYSEAQATGAMTEDFQFTAGSGARTASDINVRYGSLNRCIGLPNVNTGGSSAEWEASR